MAENPHLRLWTRFADIDPKHTKPITGKPYKGTSPKPQYVIQLLTELFGPVGQGFGWTVEAEGFTPLGEEILHWCRIRFWWRDKGEERSSLNAFESYGQTKAYMKTKSGLMMDEDAPKKSLTDAITKAASQIGIASNLFMGRWDDSRYVDEVNREYRAAERQEAQTSSPTTPPEPAPEVDVEAVKGWLLRQIAKPATVADLDRVLAHEAYRGKLSSLYDAGATEAAKEVMEKAKEKRAGLHVPMPNADMAEAVGELPGAFHG